MSRPGARSKQGPRSAKKLKPGKRTVFISPWQLSIAEARALDLICICESNLDAANYIKRALHTFEFQLQKAYMRLAQGGVVFTGHKRVEAMNVWQAYWRSEEGKANLRNVLLTESDLA